ncbi:MAG: hypothetical protein PHQ40_12265 [Anaerolineaceae bacterium]|nr:hypothetical protein [Anaerolineaceae bacterium]
MRLKKGTCITVLATVAIVVSSACNPAKPGDAIDVLHPVPSASMPVLYGFTGFPYDLSMDALNKVHQLVLENSTIYAIHRDGPCVPWREMLNGKPLPQWLEKDLRDLRSRIPEDMAVYAAITPTQQDRVSLSKQCGVSKDITKPLPSEIDGAQFDAPQIQQAYLAYAQTVIDILKPAYVNLGIEISEMSLRQPSIWPQFETLYLNTVSGLRQSHPKVKLVLEVVLQSLMEPRVADQVRPAVEASDYIGIGFYPYGSDFGKLFGAPGATKATRAVASPPGMAANLHK